MDKMFKNFLKFFIVGCIAFGIDITSYFALLLLDFPSAIAKSISFILGVSVGYILNSLFTFNNSQLAATELKKYILLYLGSMFINMTLNEYFLSFLRDPALGNHSLLIAVLLATSVSLLINFFGLRYYVFKK